LEDRLKVLALQAKVWESTTCRRLVRLFICEIVRKQAGGVWYNRSTTL